MKRWIVYLGALLSLSAIVYAAQVSVDLLVQPIDEDTGIVIQIGEEGAFNGYSGISNRIAGDGWQIIRIKENQYDTLAQKIEDASGKKLRSKGWTTYPFRKGLTNELGVVTNEAEVIAVDLDKVAQQAANDPEGKITNVTEVTISVFVPLGK